MPNIMICGYEPHKAGELKGRIQSVMKALGLEEDAVTSIVQMEVESCDGLNTPVPYLRVCSTDEDQIQKIIRALKLAGLKEDLEYLVLTGFIPAKEMV